MKRSLAKQGGFTLPEILIGIVVGSMVMAAVTSSYVFIAKSCVSLNDYADLDQESRYAVETFSREVRIASDISGFSSSGLTLTCPDGSGGTYDIDYTYQSSDKTFYRAYGTAEQEAMLTGVEAFALKRYNLLHNAASNDLETKQIQLEAKTVRSGGTKFRTTNNVLSARFVMRNKVACN